MLFNQQFKTSALVHAAVDVLSTRGALGYSGEFLAFRLLQNALAHEGHLILRKRIFNFAITPAHKVIPQTLNILTRLRQVLVAPIGMLGANGRVVVRAGLELPLTPILFAPGRYKIDLRVARQNGGHGLLRKVFFAINLLLAADPLRDKRGIEFFWYRHNSYLRLSNLYAKRLACYPVTNSANLAT